MGSHNLHDKFFCCTAGEAVIRSTLFIEERTIQVLPCLSIKLLGLITRKRRAMSDVVFIFIFGPYSFILEGGIHDYIEPPSFPSFFPRTFS